MWEDLGRALLFQKNYEGAEFCFSKEKNPGDFENITLTYIILYEHTKKEKFLKKAKKWVEFINENKKEKYLKKIKFYLGESLEEFEGEIYEDIIDLFPDTELYNVFKLIDDINLGKERMEKIKEVFGEKGDKELKALYLRSIYFDVYEDNILKLNKNDRWIAIIYFYLEGYTNENIEKLKKIIKNKKINVEKLPLYTRLIAKKYIKKHKEDENFENLIKYKLFIIKKIDEAYQIVNKLKYKKEDIKKAKEILKKIGINIEENGLKFIIKLKKIRFEKIKDYAEKIKILYNEDFKKKFLKRIFKEIKLTEKEKEELI